MELIERNGVKFYRSELLPCPHGFATRIGGVSRPAHTESLNLAFERGDEDRVVLENLARFTKALGLCPESVISLPQVHGSEVLLMTKRECGEGYFRKTDRSADGYCTTDPSVSIGVKTADCVPILLCGLSEVGEVVAVAALHAGWRGTAARIAEKGIARMNALGIPSERIRAAIGPSIGACCYEVDAEFRDVFLKAFGESLIRTTFSPRKSTEDERYTADLKEINRQILIGSGLSESAIDVSPECTCCRPELFYSHRYSHGVRGTMLNLIALPQGGACSP